MEEIFSKVFAMILGCILMLVLPMTVIKERQKNMEQTYLYSETINFVDSVCNKGIINEELYIAYLKNISKAGEIYNVKLERNMSNTDGLNEYTVKINEILELEHSYKMNRGDLFRVEVVDADNNPVLYYGGMIKDEDY